MKTEAAICMATLSNDSNTVVNIVKGVVVNIREEATSNNCTYLISALVNHLWPCSLIMKEN